MTYALPVTCEDALTVLTYASARPPASVICGVTFVHVFPPSRVSWTLPSLVPAQMSPAVMGDSDMEEIANQGIPPGTPPSDDGRILSFGFVLRSGLISLQ